jgi:hypothetical protein
MRVVAYSICVNVLTTSQFRGLTLKASTSILPHLWVYPLLIVGIRLQLYREKA